jgi:hypothetical protein
MRIAKNDNHDLGFVQWCLACEAITKDEFRRWVLHVIEVVDSPPPYIFDLIDFEGYLTDLGKIVPFTPDWSPSEQEIAAISGIALSRGVSPYEPVNEKRCLKALSECSSVREWFAKLFPFINLSIEQAHGS